jgi:hypothetical protein
VRLKLHELLPSPDVICATHNNHVALIGIGLSQIILRAADLAGK